MRAESLLLLGRRWLPGLLLMAGLVAGYWWGTGPTTGGPTTSAAASDSDAHAGHDHAAGASEEAPVYTCSMHPQIERPVPGKCPLCGMDLILRAPVGQGHDGRNVALSAAAVRLAHVETTPVVRGDAHVALDLVGEVTWDETRLSEITAWLGGRIERMYVDFRGMRIRKGDHLYRLYSPEIVTAQGELQQANRAIARLGGASPAVRESAERTLEAVRSRLGRWGLSARQVAALERDSKVTDQITVHAPQSGVVIERAQVEGTWVETGTRLYRIGELDHVWVEAWAFPQQLPWLAFGQRAHFTVSALPGHVFEGRVAFIDPDLDAKVRANKVRLTVPNPEGLLKPGMYARVQVLSDTASDGRHMVPELEHAWVCPMHPHASSDHEGRCPICGMRMVKATELGYAVPDPDAPLPLMVPTTAPLRAGRRDVVYVATPAPDGGQRFEVRDVVLGPRTDNGFIVRSGLVEGEEVVREGAFKIDAELQLRGGDGVMTAHHGVTSMPADAPALLHAIDGPGADEPSADPAPDASKDQAPRARRAAAAPARADTTHTHETKDKKTDHGEHAGDATPASGPAEASTAEPPPAAAGSPLAAVVRAYLTLQARLAADDEPGAASAWTRLAADLEAAARNLPAHAAALRDAARGRPTTLKDHRKGFQRVSRALLAVFAAAPALAPAPLRRFHCPMAFEGTGAEWLQAEGTRLANPFFGAAMLRCGDARGTVGP